MGAVSAFTVGNCLYQPMFTTEVYRIKQNLHPWVRVDQAVKPLPPRTLSILEGLALKLVYLFNHN